MFRRTATAMMKQTSPLLEGNWREKMTYSRYLSIATRSLHKTVVEKEQSKYNKFSEIGFEAIRPLAQGGNEKVTTVPNEYEKM